jgi:hypothetical protein
VFRLTSLDEPSVIRPSNRTLDVAAHIHLRVYRRASKRKFATFATVSKGSGDKLSHCGRFNKRIGHNIVLRRSW